jgi:hypothetical protein
MRLTPRGQLLSSAGDIRSENMRSSQKWSMQANRFTFDNYEVGDDAHTSHATRYTSHVSQVSFSVDEHGGVTVLGIALADLQVHCQLLTTNQRAA